MRPDLRNQHPELNNVDISKLIADKWKNATDDQKKYHMDKEAEQREEYQRKLTEWNEMNNSNELVDELVPSEMDDRRQTILLGTSTGDYESIPPFSSLVSTSFYTTNNNNSSSNSNLNQRNNIGHHLSTAGGGVSDFFRSFVMHEDDRYPSGGNEYNGDSFSFGRSSSKKEEEMQRSKRKKTATNNNSINSTSSINPEMFQYCTVPPLDIAFADKEDRRDNKTAASFLTDPGPLRLMGRQLTGATTQGTEPLWLQQVRLAQHQLDEKKSSGCAYRKSLMNNSKLTLTDKNGTTSATSENKVVVVLSKNQSQSSNSKIPLKKQQKLKQMSPPIYSQSDFSDFVSNTFYNFRADDLEFYQNSYIDRLDEMNDDHSHEFTDINKNCMINNNNDHNSIFSNRPMEVSHHLLGRGDSNSYFCMDSGSSTSPHYLSDNAIQ